MNLKLKKSIKITFIIVVLAFAVILFHHDTKANKNDSEVALVPTIIHVPSDVGNLQSAISQVPDGGIIEMASGTYHSPDNGLGFVIHNMEKGFTIRSAEGANVILDGGGNRKILHFVNSDLSLGGWVVFNGITFANGYSETDGLAGGVTMQRSQATFINCVFRNNSSLPPRTGAGGILVASQSTAFFSDCEWRDNIAKNYGAGLAVQDDADAFVQNSLFTNNRTNASGHASWAAGGGIHVGNSSLNVSNSRFEYNQAGYVGGAIYARGDWNNPVTTPKTKVIIANSTFYQNKAEPNNVHLSVPTEGGAVHIEDQSVTKIFNSRFILNSSETGGGVNIYRAKVEITDSVFLGNQAVGLGAENGFGGAISAISNDVSSDGGNNRPPADLTIKNTYIQGRYGSIGSVGQVGGGIFVAGDKVRTYGLFGVSRLGTLADNRARLTMENVAIFDSDVTENINTPGSGFGGGIFTDLSVISIQDSIITSSDAIGLNTSGGGGIALIHHSLANINNTTILGNSAGKYGGGVFVQGSYLHLTDCNMVYNEISPGVQELVDTSYGAAIFSSPDTSNNINVTGSVDNCMISENIGLPIYDDDRTGGPINDLRYNNNKIYSTHFSDEVYSSGGVIGVWRLNVNQLNNAVVTRNNGTVTDKVQNPNTALTTVPKVGSLVVAPSQVLPTNAMGDGSSINPAYLVYGWGGSNAQLDGSSLTAKSGVIATSTTGTHHLNVGGQSYYNYLNMGVAPTAELSGDNTYLSWDVTQGSFLTGAMDQGILIPPVPSGSVNNGIMPNRVYRYYTITEEGGVMVSYDNSTPLLSVSTSVTVLSGLNREKNFGSFTLFNIGGSNMNWDASTSSNWVDIIPDSGSTTEFDSIWFELHVKNFSPGTYSANISIDAGEAGSRNVQVSVIVLETIHSTQLPMITR